jgi:hypothetical protein
LECFFGTGEQHNNQDLKTTAADGRPERVARPDRGISVFGYALSRQVFAGI